jgi:DNA-directed RNA polymerase specialized sigma24 family protein
VSLTEALRGGAPDAFGMLYDEYAERLYAYCHIVVGDEAADAVRDAFIAAARHPGTAPRDDAGLAVWLYALARAECVRRGALVRKVVATPSTDPVRRALARLRPEHREALALSATLEPAEIARVMGVARDTAEMLVRVSRRRLEQAVASILGAHPDEAVFAALTTGELHTLVMRGYDPPPRQRERVLFSCAAAERAADGALLFDEDGMPIPLDALFSGADEPTHPFGQVDPHEPATEPLRQVDPKPAPSPVTVRTGHARPKKEPFLSRRRDGMLEVAGLAACVAAATSVLALWPSPHPNGASNVDGTSLFVHHPGTASRSVFPAPAGNGVPPQATTSKPGASPSPKPSTTGAAPTTAPPETTAARPGGPSTGGPYPAHPTPPPSTSPPDSPPPSSDTPTPTATPTPSDTPTDDAGETPAPDPSGR